MAFSLASQAQDINVIEGQEIMSKMKMIDVVENIDGQLITVFFSEKKYYLRSYNMNLEITTFSELKFEYKDKRLKYDRIVKIKNRLFILGSFINRKSKKNYLIYQEIDPKTLKTIDGLKILGIIPFQKRGNCGKFRFVYSRNQKRVLIYHYLPYNKEGRYKLSFSVLDSNLNKLWQKEITLPYSEVLFAVKDFVVDDEGNVFVIGKKWKDKNKDVINEKINFTFAILAYKNNGKEKREYKLDLKDKMITQVKLTIDKRLNLICTGFYTNNKNYYSLGGSFFLKIDYELGDIMVSNYKDFSFDYITSLMGENEKKKAEKESKKLQKKGKTYEMPKYDIDELIIRDDGGVLMIAERAYLEYYTITDASGHSHTSRLYDADNIIVVNFNPDGNIKWARKVPKYQVAGSPYYLSYVIAAHKDNLYFIYNDDIRNAAIEKEVDFVAFRVNSKVTNLVAYRINSNGETDYRPLIKVGKGNTMVVPQFSLQLKHSNDIILYSVWNKKQKLYRIEFDK